MSEELPIADRTAVTKLILCKMKMTPRRIRKKKRFKIIWNRK